jgi:hypothetical protein
MGTIITDTVGLETLVTGRLRLQLQRLTADFRSIRCFPISRSLGSKMDSDDFGEIQGFTMVSSAVVYSSRQGRRSLR